MPSRADLLHRLGRIRDDALTLVETYCPGDDDDTRLALHYLVKFLEHAAKALSKGNSS